MPVTPAPNRRFVVTGGPGAGKSTLVAAMRTEGFTTFPEAGRALLRLSAAIDAPAHAARDPRAYAEAMLVWDMRSWAEANGAAAPCIFDRGIPDIIGYLRLIGRPVPPHLQRAALAFRYADPVFVAPPWRDIYRMDGERRHDFAEALATHDAIRAVYDELGYRLLDLPLASVEARAAFVAAAIAQ